MTKGQGPGSRSSTDQARDVLDAAVRGAEANDRPDLIARLRRARDDLAGPCGARTRGGQDDLVRAAVEQAVRALDSLEADLRARRHMLDDPSRAARLRAELADARVRYERFSTLGREWPHALGDGFATVNSDLDFYLRSRVRDVLSEAERAINGGDPGRDADREMVQAWLHQRLVAEADRAYRRLDAGARHVAEQVANQLGLARPHRFVAPRLSPPERLVAELPAPPPMPSGHAPMPARLLTVFMPAYGGIMMALVLSRFLGLALPGWLIGVCAVVGAITLGGAALSGERGRQRDRRRAEAVIAARSMVEEFHLALSKQLRDGARALHQDLRRATTDVVNRRSAALTEELDSARAAASAAERATTELGHIEEDRNTLAELREQALTLLRVAPAPATTRGLRLISGDARRVDIDPGRDQTGS